MSGLIQVPGLWKLRPEPLSHLPGGSSQHCLATACGFCFCCSCCYHGFRSMQGHCLGMRVPLSLLSPKSLTRAPSQTNDVKGHRNVFSPIRLEHSVSLHWSSWTRDDTSTVLFSYLESVESGVPIFGHLPIPRSLQCCAIFSLDPTSNSYSFCLLGNFFCHFCTSTGVS